MENSRRGVFSVVLNGGGISEMRPEMELSVAKREFFNASEAISPKDARPPDTVL